MLETREQYKARIAAWAATFWQEREARLLAENKPENGVFDRPNATFAEVAEAAMAKSGISDSARANMSAAATEREARKRALAGTLAESGELTRPKITMPQGE